MLQDRFGAQRSRMWLKLRIDEVQAGGGGSGAQDSGLSPRSSSSYL